jgi:integrase
MENDGVTIDQKNLRAAFDKGLRKVKDFTPDINTHLVAFAEDFIKNAKKTGDMKTQYQTTLNNIIEYEKEKEVKLKLTDIDLEFYDEFVEFLRLQDYAPNTIGNRIKNLKLFLNVAFKKKIPVCLDFKLPDFKKITEETFSVYLNEDELLRLYRLDLKDNAIQEKTRDLFLIGAYTGFRFSDYSTLCKRHFNVDDTIQKRTEKQELSVVLPVHPIVQKIIKRNNGEIPKVGYGTFKSTLREICQIAKIDNDVTYVKTRGDKSETITEPKWKLIGSHTARRSFATNAYLGGVPSISIMKMTGHKTESSFMKYIKITLTENAKILQSHQFFTNDPDAVQEKKPRQKAARNGK